MSRPRLGALCALLIVLLTSTRSAVAESLFHGPAPTSLNIHVVTVDVKYTVFNKAAGIGKFSAIGTPQWFADPSNTITGGQYKVEAFFDLATGAVRLNDPNSLLHVDGTENGSFKTFFHSTSLKAFGSGTEDTFDAIFKSNVGSVMTGSDVSTRIMGVSIPTFNDPSFQYLGAGGNGTVIWDNTPFAGGIEKGTANVWAPTPDAAKGGLVLFAGLATFLAFRRFSGHGSKSA
jgi:hypothetical protein